MSAGAARLCGRCGRVRPISQRAGPDGPDICSSCWRPPTAVCTVCGDERPCSASRGRSADLQPLPAAPNQPVRPLRRDPARCRALARRPDLRPLLHRRAASHRYLHPLRAPPAPGRPAGPGRQHLRRVFGRRTRRARLHGLRRRRQALHPRLLRPMHPGATHRRTALRPQRRRAQHACRGPRRHRGDQHPTHRAELATQGSRRRRSWPRSHAATSR